MPIDQTQTKECSMTTQHGKPKSAIQLRLLLIPVGLALICSAGVAVAQDLIINTFDSDIGGIDWQNFRGIANNEVWDPSQDADSNPNSGSMYLTVNWPTLDAPNWTSSWTDVQIAFGTPQFNSTAYVSFEADIKVDTTNSFPAEDGSYGAIELIVNNPWQNVLGWAPLLATNSWQHFAGSFSAIPPTNYQEAIVGFISSAPAAFTNTVSYWIDNIIFTAVQTTGTNGGTNPHQGSPSRSDLPLQPGWRHLATPNDRDGQE